MNSDVLDPDTWVKTVAVLERARKRNLDPAEQLHRHGLLRTPQNEHQIRVETMEFILNELVSWRPAEMLRSKFLPAHTASPTDMYSAIVSWIEKHIAHAKSNS